MAPSRGFLSTASSRQLLKSISHKRYSSFFTRAVTEPSNKYQIYVSRTTNPYLNLSIEHYLLQKSSPDSTVLFLYTNTPCIVLGRNQNPWVEVNLNLLNTSQNSGQGKLPAKVDLVRRRSGGGTVFHDLGNVNYSVIVPTSRFDRDRHAEMVVRALHANGIHAAQVNQRHDIILAETSARSSSDPTGEKKPYKISGSAYKLTRLRSLHHGTCLLSSPYLKSIGSFLRSPAKQFINARGVDSVSSPITNVNITNESFEESVIAEFKKLYDCSFVETNTINSETVLSIPDIAKGHAELKSWEWIYLQTPQFTFSNRVPIESLAGQLTVIGPPEDRANETHLEFTARNGAISEWKLQDKYGSQFAGGDKLGLKIHEIVDWRNVIGDGASTGSFGTWLNRLFGKRLQE